LSGGNCVGYAIGIMSPHVPRSESAAIANQASDARIHDACSTEFRRVGAPPALDLAGIGGDHHQAPVLSWTMECHNERFIQTDCRRSAPGRRVRDPHTGQCRVTAATNVSRTGARSVNSAISQNGGGTDPWLRRLLAERRDRKVVLRVASGAERVMMRPGLFERVAAIIERECFQYFRQGIGLVADRSRAWRKCATARATAIERNPAAKFSPVSVLQIRRPATRAATSVFCIFDASDGAVSAYAFEP
jgi:hypothetical protein